MTSTRWSVDADSSTLRRDGEPWFLLGDTAWELLRRLSLDQAEHYLQTRSEQGFNTVLAVAFSEFDARSVPNVAGDLPFEDDDVARPNEPYWRHVDTVVARAAEHHLTVALLPTWGNHWHDRGTAATTFFQAGNAFEYGRWIATRYQHHDIIWVLGGDRPIDDDDQRATVDAMATGIRSVVGDRQLLTFHPPGRASSSDFLADTDWIDFDMIQSGHAGLTVPNYQLVEQDRSRAGSRPTLDAEPNYEDHPVMSPNWGPVLDWRFHDGDVRRAAYHAVFAGACGHVYGAHPVWQMYQPGVYEPINHPARPWDEALRLPGAVQMKHLRTFVESVDIATWEPDQRVVHHGTGFLDRHQRAMVRRGEPAVMAYLPAGRAIELDLRRWPAGSWSSRWFDPRSAEWSAGDSHHPGGRSRMEHPRPGSDAVLYLEPSTTGS